jgi:4'-phosphopantetheinyl transferase
VRTEMSPLPRLPMADGNIDIWLAFYAEICDAAQLAAIRALLSDVEREQVARFRFADDRQRCLVTRAMVRTVLSRYAPIAPAEWTFSTNDFGRPEISNAAAEARGLCFNLSHSRGLIALGVSRRCRVGVDVENIRTRDVSAGIAEHFFAPGEAAALAGVAPDRRQDRFFEYWTFKESYIKARGMGLSIPLDRFSMHFPHDRAVRLDIDPELGDDGSRWRLWQFRPTPAHLLAVCAQRLREDEVVLSTRRIIPAHSEEAFGMACVRRQR